MILLAEPSLPHPLLWHGIHVHGVPDLDAGGVLLFVAVAVPGLGGPVPFG